MILEFADSALEFAYINAGAAKKALSMGRVGRAEWIGRFAKVRKAMEKPKEKITSIAVRLPSGHTEYAPFARGHQSIISKLTKRDAPGIKAVGFMPEDPHYGFRTNKQPFVSRKEGLRIVKKEKQKTLHPGNYREGLHSGDMV